MVILVDDEDRENEGDLCMAAETVTPEAINFMAMHGRGLICLRSTEEQVATARAADDGGAGRSGPPLGTAFTVSIEARHGVTTGISAADRAHTIRWPRSPDARARQISSRRATSFRSRAQRGGVLVRTGQTEGSVDLARLAGPAPAGVICEIMNDDGTMARMPDLERSPTKHGLLIFSIADLIQYRLQTERLVRRVAEHADRARRDRHRVARRSCTRSSVERPAVSGAGAGRRRDDRAGALPRALRLARRRCVQLDAASIAARNLRAAHRAIEDAGRGVVLYIPPRGSRCAPSSTRSSRASWRARARRAARATRCASSASARRCWPISACSKLRLLTNNPTKIAGLTGFGLWSSSACRSDPSTRTTS